jgi:hypothetical protein
MERRCLCGDDGRTKRWTRAAIWSGKMAALTRRGLVNAVVRLSGKLRPLRFWLKGAL